MSLRDIVDRELSRKLASLTVEDLRAVIRAASLGMGPDALYLGIQAVANGEDYQLPAGGGSPAPIKVQAWSFVNDHGQYHDTYNLSSARAGELKDLLRQDLNKGIAEITTVVSAALRQRGSNRPVIVNAAGMPGGPPTDHTPAPAGGTARAALKAEIRNDAAYYGSYSFESEDTGRAGNLHFRTSLGGGLYAAHASKQGAIDVARICRKHGRTHDLVRDHVCLWLAGTTPLFGTDIPEKVTFTGALPPNGRPPPVPTAKAKTVAPSTPVSNDRGPPGNGGRTGGT